MTKVPEYAEWPKSLPLAVIHKRCHWAGCEESLAPGVIAEEQGWYALILHNLPPEPGQSADELVFGKHCLRDAVLCPTHAAELNGLLVDIGKKYGQA